MRYFILFLISILIVKAQEGQTIRGKVLDAESLTPIPFATIILYKDTLAVGGAYTDTLGNFKIENVRPGRYSLKITAPYYEPAYIDELIVIAGKEKVLTVKLQEKVVRMEEVVISETHKGEPINEMATISAREFSIRETERYAGSRGDPSRMVSVFPGVQGANDTRNDIVVRGNSPMGVLWQIDGVRIPNPNHFVIPGTQGGPISILNQKYLSNSDFYTSAFPAEYGNAIAAVFDLNMRNGNNEKYEYDFQFGLLGAEALVEGPIKRQKSSFLINYRYSTLQIFNLLNIKLGTDFVPKYQDAAFRLHFNTKNNTMISFWGIGGKSNIDAVISAQKKPDPEQSFKYGDNNRDQYFGSQTQILGTTILKTFQNNSYLKISIAGTNQRVDAFHNLVVRHVDSTTGLYVVDSLPPILDYTFQESKITSHIKYNKKISTRTTIRFGSIIELYNLTFIDSVREFRFIGNSVTLSPWKTRWLTRNDKNVLLQPYINLKYRITEKTTLVAGITSLYYSINNKNFSPIEPRIGFQHQIDSKQKINAGIGLHSQTLPNYLFYFSDSIVNGQLVLYNKDAIGLIKSFHSVAGYQIMLGHATRFKTEIYYQYLFNIPVEKNAKTPYSLINSGSGFSRFFPPPLENKGTARNYGIELTLERFFTKQFYYLITGSLYDSKYRGSDGVLRNTVFNGNYILNVVGGKEFRIKQKSSVNINTRITWAGNKRYGDVDTAASNQRQEIVYLYNDNYNKYKFRDYFRWDIRINFILNAKKTTHEIGLDLINLLNTKNILTITYVPSLNPPIREEYQLGFLPIFYYRINF